MSLKKFLYDLFFKKKKRSRKKKSQTSGARSTRTSSRGRRNSSSGKVNYDTSLLRQQVSETDYISNLRIGRSWILPQLVQMGFKKDWKRSDKFSATFLESNIHKKYNATPQGRWEIWNLMRRNYKVIADSNASSARARWWTKELLVEMIEWEAANMHKRFELQDLLDSVASVSDPKQMYEVVEKYCDNRYRNKINKGSYRNLTFKPIPNSFVDAFMGDGAYNAMMTMVKVFGIRIRDNGRELSRDESIDEIESQAAILNGRDLLNYCKEVFFDSGAFEYKKYIKKA